jgi:hypothetical protein
VYDKRQLYTARSVYGIAGYCHGISDYGFLQKAQALYTTVFSRIVYFIEDAELMIPFAKLHIAICHDNYTLLYHNHSWQC